MSGVGFQADRDRGWRLGLGIAVPFLVTGLALSALAQPFDGASPAAPAAPAAPAPPTAPPAPKTPPAPDGGDETLPEQLPPYPALPFLLPPGDEAQRPPVESVERSPGFTQGRQFTNARLWALDTGRWTVEQWWSGDWGVPRALAGANHQDDQLLQTEVGLGILPHLELDVAANVDLNQDNGGDYQISPNGLSGVSAEARITIGDHWGQIWGNPTLDLELWGRVSQPTRLEGRLLGGGQVLTPKLLGTVNLMFARNSFRQNVIGIDYESKADLGLSYELVPDVLRLGAEATVGWDSHDTVNTAGITLLHAVAQVGPAILLTEPHKRLKLLAAILCGLADWDAPWESQLVLGTTF